MRASSAAIIALLVIAAGFLGVAVYGFWVTPAPSGTLYSCSATHGCEYTPAIKDFLNKRAAEERSMAIAALFLATVAIAAVAIWAHSESGQPRHIST